MNNKKYELLKNDIITVNNRTLYEIRALKDFSDVKREGIGGYIEKEDNLSHDDNCWIYGNDKEYWILRCSCCGFLQRYCKVSFVRFLDNIAIYRNFIKSYG